MTACSSWPGRAARRRLRRDRARAAVGDGAPARRGPAGQPLRALGAARSGSSCWPWDGATAAPTAPGRPPRLPRVSFWSIWNEPNQPGWLAPQWRPRAGGAVPTSRPAVPRLRRCRLCRRCGAPGTRRDDTILIGELAPEGDERPGRSRPIAAAAVPARAVLRRTATSSPLTGAGGAGACGCPAGGSPRAFVTANPGLFAATGFAHHPVLVLPVPRRPRCAIPNFVPLSDLGRLEHALDRIFAAYGVHRRAPALPDRVRL